MTDPVVVVVGAGLAAAKAVEQLRDSGFEGPVVLYGEEEHLPYERPPLSKSYLMGKSEWAAAAVHDRDWYDAQGIELRLGNPVTAIDLAGHTLHTEGGSQPYGQLLLATGASPRRLATADESGVPVTYLRTVEDSNRLREQLVDGARVAIVGGGWIGLEVAAAAREAGCAVTVLESLALPLLRVLGPEVAERFAALHREHGVELRTGVELTSIEQHRGAALLTLGGGDRIDADVVVVGVGVQPNVALAEQAGLDVDNGLLVDEHLRASDPAVFAAGDIANSLHPVLKRRVRVEHWDNAISQGRVAARNMLGEDVVHDRLPYFFTDQYDLGMEYVGSVGPDGHDEVVLRDSAAPGVFTAFWLRGGLIQAGMHVNDWDAIEPIRGLVGTSPDLAALRDTSVPLSEVATAS